MSAADRYPSYRAPQGDREILCVPTWDEVLSLLPIARKNIHKSETAVGGRPLNELANSARRSLLLEAIRYTSEYTSVPFANATNGPLILTGHQPELVHAGVWLKNFAASKLAKSVGGVAVNLIIDNDLCRNASARVPTGTVERPQIADLKFDESAPEMPYEERTIQNRDLWNSFGERVANAVSNLVPNSLAADWWTRYAIAASKKGIIGTALAQARHELELEWGSQTVEIPQSRVCNLSEFRVFAIHLLSNAGRLRDAYNGALAEYRMSHGLRNAAQPLPDLEESDGWIETPFWIWTAKDPARRSLYVRSVGDGIELSDLQACHASLPYTDTSAVDSCVQMMGAWELEGVKIRSRALITTLFARLLLADSFIHGIGGAKYDQVTDRLCERFFGISLPPFVVLSGTLRLPIEHETIRAGRAQAIRQRLREMRFHPEVHVDAAVQSPAATEEILHWKSKKQGWVQTAKTEENCAERHAQINLANEKLQAWLAGQREKLERELEHTVAQTRTNQLLESREYPFCLFPRELLQSFLLEF